MPGRWKLLFPNLVSLLFVCGAVASGPARAGDEKGIPGTGAVAGTVTASKPFTAAQVYLRSADKPVTFMVYTSGGKYRAINILPGEYEIRVARKGFAADARTITVRAGAIATADFVLKDADPAPATNVNGPASIVAYPGRATIVEKDVEFVDSYDKLYPPGPGRVVLERTCTSCHGVNVFPLKQWDRAAWDAAINMMSRREGMVGIIVPPGKLTPKDRNILLDYLTANFGPDAKKRALSTDAEMPVDEAALSKAMYVEYDMPRANTPNARPRGQNPYLDNDGNVWVTDRGAPNAIVRLDPRTATLRSFSLPEQGGPHGITVDAKGTVWWGENRWPKLGSLDPATGKIEYHSMDPRDVLGPNTQGQDPIVDSQQNVWFTVIVGNRIGRWDRTTGKVTVWEPPTPNSYPYGIDKDKSGNIWFSQFVQCRVAKFDPKTEQFTEYPVLTAYEDPYCLIRRLSVDSKGTVWYAVFSHGVIGKLDPESGKMIEYKVPMAFSQPYDIWPDAADNLWISDGGLGGAIIRFDPRSEKFTFYPALQRGDMPKVEITREGAIWYSPRSAARGTIGVLYPDVTKMTTFEARY
jgi:virginiamycin B lyase